jgi:cell division protein FtsI (penicillin-binding protein 3)
VIFFSFALVIKLVQVQVVDGATYAHDESSEIEANVVLSATRGAMYDRSGDLLSASAPRYDVVADDMLISDPASAAATLAPLLHVSSSTLTADLSQRDNGYVVLAKQVSGATENAIAKENIGAITFSDDSTRVSPGGELFQPVLGSVNAAGEGYSALEYEFNDVLNGIAGREEVAEDPAGSELPSGAKDIVPAKQGQSLVLTLDGRHGCQQRHRGDRRCSDRRHPCHGRSRAGSQGCHRPRGKQPRAHLDLPAGFGHEARDNLLRLAGPPDLAGQ